jgi:hypothetical protein
MECSTWGQVLQDQTGVREHAEMLPMPCGGLQEVVDFLLCFSAALFSSARVAISLICIALRTFPVRFVKELNMRLCEVDDHPNEPRLLTSLLFMSLTTSSVKSVCLAHRKTSIGHATPWMHLFRSVCCCFQWDILFEGFPVSDFIASWCRCLLFCGSAFVLGTFLNSSLILPVVKGF